MSTKCNRCRRNAEYVMVWGCLEGHLGDTVLCADHKNGLVGTFEAEKTRRERGLPATTFCSDPQCRGMVDEYAVQLLPNLYQLKTDVEHAIRQAVKEAGSLRKEIEELHDQAQLSDELYKILTDELSRPPNRTTNPSVNPDSTT